MHSSPCFTVYLNRIFFPGNFANFRRNIGILMANLLGAVCNQQLARFSCEFVLCRLKIVSLASSANLNLEYNPE